MEKSADCLPLVYRGLSAKLRMKAEKELHESEEKIHNGLMRLKQYIKDENLPCCCEEDFLVIFLRSKKFDVKRSWAQLQGYSFNRHNLMSYYGFMSHRRTVPAIRAGIVGLLPTRDREGRAVLFFRASAFSSDTVDPDDVLRSLQAAVHLALSFPATQVAGLCLVADAQVTSLDMLGLLFKYVRFALPTMHSLPARIARIDCFNVNVVFRSCLTLVRPLMPAKLRNRIHLHGDKSGLLETYEASMLPEELGGTSGSIVQMAESWLPDFEEFLPKFQASNMFFKRKNTVPFPESFS